MKKGLRITIWVAVFLFAISVVAFTLISNKEKATDDINKELIAVPFTVQTSYVKEETFSDVATFRGNVEARNTITIYSEADGKLISSAIEIGRFLSKGQVVGSIDKALRSAANQINNISYEKAKADYDIARRNVERYESLLKENNATAVEVENARLQLTSSELQLKTLLQQISISQRQVGQTLIVAPASGIVIEKKAHPGDYMQPGTPIGTIAELSSVIVRILVPETFITKLKTGTPVSMTADVYPDIRFNGTIKNIIPVANETKAFPVEIEIPNSKRQKLMAGMSMSATFKPNTSLTVLTVPRTAIVGDFSKPAVYIVDSEKKPRLTAISLGRDFGTTIEITSGLKKGSLAITSGQSNIEPGKVLKNYSISDQ